MPRLFITFLVTALLLEYYDEHRLNRLNVDIELQYVYDKHRKEKGRYVSC